MSDAWHRVFWSALVIGPPDGTTWLEPQPGALHVRVSQRNLGQHNSRRRDERLAVEVGDTFIVMGPSTAETMMARVVEVDGYQCRVDLDGELEPTTNVVQLTECRALRRKRRTA